MCCRCWIYKVAGRFYKWADDFRKFVKQPGERR